jgi:K+-sensing histidine kinase KdpD
MKKLRFSLSPHLLTDSFAALLAVVATAIPLFLIGRQALGEGVVALAFLVPVAWSAYRWGQLPGIAAALAAGLCFNFLFIPPFYTFVIGSLEGWLILAIFLGVAILVVGRIQAGLSQAREATFMYEMSTALCGLRTQEAVAYTAARQIRQLFQADLVTVVFQPAGESPNLAVSAPADRTETRRPDRMLPLVNAWGLIGEIHIWRGSVLEVPPEDSRLLANFTSQVSRSFERTRSLEIEANARAAAKASARTEK